MHQYPKEIKDHNGTRWFHQYGSMYSSGRTMRSYDKIMEKMNDGETRKIVWK